MCFSCGGSQGVVTEGNLIGTYGCSFQETLNGDHIWWFDLDSRQWPRWALSAEELRRSCRFRMPLDRARYVSARSAVRMILAAYVGECPGSLLFGYTGYGKPVLRNHPGLHFNLTHSESLAGLSVSTRGIIGIDCEVIRPMGDIYAVASHAFSQQEFTQLIGKSGLDLLRFFFEVWTRKESILKALGVGLTIPMSGVITSASVGVNSICATLPGYPTVEVSTFSPREGVVASVSAIPKTRRAA